MYPLGNICIWRQLFSECNLSVYSNFEQLIVNDVSENCIREMVIKLFSKFGSCKFVILSENSRKNVTIPF